MFKYINEAKTGDTLTIPRIALRTHLLFLCDCLRICPKWLQFSTYNMPQTSCIYSKKYLVNPMETSSYNGRTDWF